MNVMNRFTLRSLKKNRKWTVVTLIGIIISTAMIAAVSTFFASFVELMRNEAIATGGNWHATVSDVRVADLSVFEDASFVDKISLSRNLGYAVLGDSENENKPYLFISQFDAASSAIFPTELVEGRMPQNDRELVISEHLEANGGVRYEMGDTLTLEIGKRTNPDMSEDFFYDQNSPYEWGSEDSAGEVFIPQLTRSFTVVGIIKRPNFEPTWAPGYTALSFLDPQVLNAGDTVSVTLLVKKLNHKLFENVTALAEQVSLDANHIVWHNELLRYFGIVSSDRLQNVIYGFAVVFIIIIMIASVSLIFNAFAISISERIGQLGMLASVGATRQQKRRSVYFEGFLLGLIGIPLGILAGIAGIGITLSAIEPLMESFANFNSGGLSLYVSPLSILAAAGLAAITIYISVWIPAQHASKIMPIDAIRQSKEIQLTRKAVRTTRLTHALFGLEGEIALKNLKRSRKKYRATVLSLIISLVLFLTVSYYTEVMVRGSSTIEAGYNFDLVVFYTNTPSAEVQQANAKIASLELVTAMTAGESTNGFFLVENALLSDLTRQVYAPDTQESVDFNAQLYCIDDVSFDTYVRSLGADPQEYHNPAQPKMILINYGQDFYEGKRAAGELLSIKPGTTLRFFREPLGSSETENEVELEVGLLTDQRPMGLLISSFRQINAVVSCEIFNSLPDQLKNIDFNNNPSFQQLFLNSTNAEKLEIQIQELVRNLTGRTIVTNISGMAQRERNVQLVMAIFIYGFITLISLISIANIFNTITTNVALRRREFAMLRSVGMTPQSFNKMIRFESLFYGLNALLYGLPISVAISLLLHQLQTDVIDIGFSLPWVSYGIAIVLLFIIVGSTMLYSITKIKKENIIDALKTETM